MEGMSQPTPLNLELLETVMNRCPEIAKTFATVPPQDIEQIRLISIDYHHSKVVQNEPEMDICMRRAASVIYRYNLEIPVEWWNVMFELCYRESDEILSVKSFYSQALKIPKKEEIPMDMLLSMRTNSIQEFLALRKDIPAACKAQAAEGHIFLTVIAQPPPPIVVRVYATRDPHFEPDFEVQMQSPGAQLIGNIDAYLLLDSFDAHPLASVPVNSMNIASFPGLRLPANFSARMNKTYILFIGFAFFDDRLTIVAAVSNPFITITNISEAPSAQAKLIWGSFNSGEDQGIVPWEALVPYFVSYFERTTSINQQSRPLVQRDILFLFSKVKNRATLSWLEFKELWAWFTKVADTCHKRLGDRWLGKVEGSDHYLVDGFLGRTETEVCLQGRPPGTFIIRFSDGKPQALVASFVSQEGRVEHKLIEPKNFEGGRTLDDVINIDLSLYLRFLLTPNGPVPAINVFRACTNTPNRHGKDGYI